MCYSAEVSLGTFLFVTAICGYLWYRNRKVDRAVALMLFVIGFMQFLEYVVWMNLECNDTNKLIGKILPVYLYFQPIVLNLIVWQMNAGTGTLYPYIVIFGTIFGLLYFMIHRSSPPCIEKSECNHLKWNTKNKISNDNAEIIDYFAIPFYYFTLFYAGGTLKNTDLANTFIVTWTGSWLITNALYKEVWASVWCHAVNASAIAALVI
jgi:hypothetical protein